MQSMPMPARRPIASYTDYAAAQAAVDGLADQRFPVERTSIVAEGLRLVEQVTGRLSWGRVLLSGATTGVVFGLLVGWILALFAPVENFLAFIAYALVIGAIAGAVAAAISYALSGGRRDFSSVSGLQAERYLLLVDDEVADEAVRLLAAAGTLSGAGQVAGYRRAYRDMEDEDAAGGAART